MAAWYWAHGRGFIWPSSGIQVVVGAGEDQVGKSLLPYCGLYFVAVSLSEADL